MARRGRILTVIAGASIASCSLFADTTNLAGSPPSTPSTDGGVDTDAAADDGVFDGTPSDGASDAAPTCPPEAALLVDPKNCGACGHDCLGGGCDAGKCQPVVLASGQMHAHWLAVDDGAVYWTDGTSVRACAKSGCDTNPTTIVSGRGSIYEVAAGAGAVVWTECYVDDAGVFSGGGAYRCATSGCTGAPSVAMEGAGCLSGVAIDAANALLYVSSPHGTTYRCNVDTCSFGSAGVVATGDLGYPAAITIANGEPFWTQGQIGLTGCKSPNCVPLGSRVIGRSQRNAFLPPSIVGDHGYWTAFWASSAQAFEPSEIPFVNGDGVVVRAPLDGDGGAGEILVNGGTPTSVVADTSAFRFTEHIGGAILECPATGCDGGPAVIANGQGRPFSLVQDDVAIYWGNYGDGRIMKLAK